MDRGISYLREIAAWIARDRVLMDWIWEMPLRLALGDACISIGDHDRATESVPALRDALSGRRPSSGQRVKKRGV